jgi:hypothetical protein
MSGLSKKRILMVSANPWDTKRLRLDQEHDAIQEVLENSSGRDRFEIKVLTATQDARFQDQMLKFKPHIVHFSGHGEEGGLAFDSGGEEPHWIANETLARFFQSAPSHPECVVFNACRTERLAEAVSEYIDYVIGMNAVINDQAAILFAQTFYRALFEDLSYREAFDQAILALEFRGLPDQFIPKLKTREQVHRISFLPECDPDILILCPEANREWAHGVEKELDDLLSSRFGSRNTFTLKLVLEGEENLTDLVEKAGLLLPVLSRQCTELDPCGKLLSAFVERIGGGAAQRVFPIQIDNTSLPEALQRLSVLPYLFWETGGHLLTPGDAQFNANMDTLARAIHDRLHALKREIKFQKRLAIARKKAKSNSEKLQLPKSFVFVNAAPEDRDLLHKITTYLNGTNAEYSTPLPILPDQTDPESDIREDLEENLEACDLQLVVYGRAPLKWVRRQVLATKKIWRGRKRDLRIVAVHQDHQNGPKENINITLNKLRIFFCPPDELSEYLPKCMAETCDE